MNQELIAKVCAKTMQWRFRMWGFGEAVALRGLLAAFRRTGDCEPLGFVKALLRCYLGRRVGTSFEEHIAPGRELLLLYELTGEEEFLCAAGQLAALHASFPKNPQGARLHRPDLQGWRSQIWVDCMDAEPPFLASLGRLSGNAECTDRAAEEIAAYARLLQDPDTGLFFHGYEEACGRNGQLWARGNGWALMGLVETLANLPPDHPRFGELRARLNTLCVALARCQRPDGFWNTVIADDRTAGESTLAAMVACALPRAFASGLVDCDAFGNMSNSSRTAVLGAVNEDGSLQFVTEATPIGEWAMYATRGFGVFPWGQGPLLLMLTQ